MSHVLIIAINARPIASSVRSLGWNVGIIDFFGDPEIKQLGWWVFSVMHQEVGGSLRRTMWRSKADYFMKLAEIMIEEVGGFDFALLGAGLDDYPAYWKALRNHVKILGNDEETIVKVRNRSFLYKTAQKYGISVPKHDIVSVADEVPEVCDSVGYPCVVRREGGSGGVNVFLLKNKGEADFIKNKFEKDSSEGKIIVMELVEGKHSSASVLGTSNDCICLSINEQLIGIDSLGSPGPFTYCGNIVPLKLGEKKILESLKEVFSSLGKALGLVGSNGFDFVLRNDEEPVILECNPRLQGSLEPFEIATNENMVMLHVLACEGELPKEIPSAEKFAVKTIVFSTESGIVPDIKAMEKNDKLHNLRIFDILLQGLFIEKNDPICTLLNSSKNREKIFETTLRKAREIQKSFKVCKTP
ncbi:MAG: ATP-grasp domain-containing protein [Candidatus Hodarchaeota archaeon]